ncbi:hypothetical protein HOE37_06450 [Candidatus Woesearchaeota archaeon]|jgi:Holliday junction resolvase|nr:hypothetical protein [Candidatus Woesearchaeota archaeon]
MSKKTNNLNLDPLRAQVASKKRKKINGKQKGASFERHLAKLLNGKFDTKDFSRTPGSGAFATTHSLPAHLQIYGDLITPKDFLFCIEAKSGYNVNLYDLVKDNSEIHKFIRQAKKDAKKAGKQWMLIYKKTRNKPLVILPKYYFKELKSKSITVYQMNISIYLLEDVLALENSLFM